MQLEERGAPRNLAPHQAGPAREPESRGESLDSPGSAGALWNRGPNTSLSPGPRRARGEAPPRWGREFRARSSGRPWAMGGGPEEGRPGAGAGQSARPRPAVLALTRRPRRPCTSSRPEKAAARAGCCAGAGEKTAERRRRPRAHAPPRPSPAPHGPARSLASHWLLGAQATPRSRPRQLRASWPRSDQAGRPWLSAFGGWKLPRTPRRLLWPRR